MAYTLITGASGGIGREFAEIFAREKHDLILVARSEQKLEDLKRQLQDTHKVTVHVLVADLSKPETALKLYETTESHGWAVDTLVNNAGFGALGPFVTSSWKRYAEMIQVNITSLTELTRLYLPLMVANKSGKILNISSTAAFQAGPLMSVYYATKAYVLSFSEGLHEELKDSGVTVTALCPGPTESNFASTAGAQDAMTFQMMKLPSSHEVAEYGYRALMQGKAIAVHGALNKVAATSAHLMPRSILRKVVHSLQKNRGNI
jgi:short-subunit dehydrogenase